MIRKITKNEKVNTVCTILLVSVLISLVLISVDAVPIGPNILVLGNSTKIDAESTKVNSTVNGTISPGGYVFILRLTSEQKNTRWKGYVGNVSGTLTLDDADDQTLFQWTLSTVSGEVYATRASGLVNWSGINCTWIADGKRNSSEGYESSNRTPEHNENKFFSHTNADDNITATFEYTNHSSMTIGSRVIAKDDCFSLQTWQNNAQQTFGDSDDAKFSEVILYDGAFNKLNGNVIYATKIYNDVQSYDTDSTYDFQMIVPEDGSLGFSSTTAYYFYVELA
jgi:hypothetical protein